jgi:catechol 2,3-dioxygenase-like lactoylglutathione lyase family enzyme
VSAGLHRVVPALPVRDVAAAVARYRTAFGFEVGHESDDFAVLLRDEAVVTLWKAGGAELRDAGVLHPTSRDGVTTTDFGTREFATMDLDGNLLSFFRFGT